MPELPDVEGFTRYFQKTSLHKKVTGIEVRAPRILENATPQSLADALTGRRFVSARRYGKYLLAEVDNGGWLYFHFGMSGFPKYFEAPREEPPYVRFLVVFDQGGMLAYDNRRMIGRVGITESPETLIQKKNLGVDALAVDFATFHERLMAGGKLKQALMDQSLVAGIGNEYSDEILFQMKLHPQTPASSLLAADFQKLYDVMTEVLKTAVASDADPDKMPQSFMLPQRQRNGKCPRCGVRFEQIKVGGRTGYFCPACQPESGKSQLQQEARKRGQRHPSP